jgi:RNA polymerase-binding transcription factor DksA
VVKRENPMNVKELEIRLREKERELWADMTRTETEARSTGNAETQNGAAAAESKESIFSETTSEWHVFAQVRDALERIKTGTFGKCVECGRRIAEDRLESIPWTAYCLHHQKEHDAVPRI